MADSKKLDELMFEEVKGFYSIIGTPEWEHLLKFFEYIREELSDISKIAPVVDKENTKDDVMFKGLKVITQRAKIDVLDKVIILIAQYKKRLEKGEKNG